MSNKHQPVVKTIRKDYSGEIFGPWKIQQYLHHISTSPIWEAECVYCGKLWESSLPKIKRKKECECEDNLRFTTPVSIVNNIYVWYIKRARKEGVRFNLSYIDLYKLYNIQGGLDEDSGEKLVFDYHWNYMVEPPTCNYIWPDLERKDKFSSYNLTNCYYKQNLKQRFRKIRRRKK